MSEHGFLVHTVESEYQPEPMAVTVLLPDVMAPGRRYPVLYVLPVDVREEGVPRWGHPLLEVKRHDLHNRYGLICVWPTFAQVPWYADHPSDPAIRQESHFLKGVVPFVAKTYPVIAEPEGRLLLGFSKSGWGAFSLLLRYPACFGRAVAWDAPLMLSVPRSYSMETFGTVENFRLYELTSLLRAKGPELGDSVRLNHFGYSSFQADHEAAHELMDTLRVPHGCREGVRREHSWTSGWLPEAVAMLCEAG